MKWKLCNLGFKYIVGILPWGDVAFRDWVDKPCVVMIFIIEIISVYCSLKRCLSLKYPLFKYEHNIDFRQHEKKFTKGGGSDSVNRRKTVNTMAK